MEERRMHVRVSCRIEVEVGVEKKWFMIYSKNIGTDGMLLISDSDIEKLKKNGIDSRKNITLSFYLSDNSNLIKVSGVIVHVERKTDPIDDKKTSFIGIQFSDVPEYTKKQLETFFLGNLKQELL